MLAKDVAGGHFVFRLSVGESLHRSVLNTISQEWLEKIWHSSHLFKSGTIAHLESRVSWTFLLMKVEVTVTSHPSHSSERNISGTPRANFIISATNICFWVKDELIQFWLSDIKGQGCRHLTKHDFGFNNSRIYTQFLRFIHIWPASMKKKTQMQHIYTRHLPNIQSGNSAPTSYILSVTWCVSTENVSSPADLLRSFWVSLQYRVVLSFWATTNMNEILAKCWTEKSIMTLTFPYHCARLQIYKLVNQ